MKFVVWFPQGLDHFISFSPGFLIPNSGFCILDALVGSKSFIELFVGRALHEDLGTIFSLFVFANP